MKLIQPIPITDDILSSTNVSEADKPAWVSTTNYTIGAQVMVVATHSLYEALTANTNKYPPDNISGELPDWLYLGSTNARKMFNQSYSAQTENIGSIVVVFEPGRINSIGLLNVEASNINIKCAVGGVAIYNKDIDMRIRAVNTIYEYFFNPIELTTESVQTDIPPTSDCVVTITISSGVDQIVKCGLCICGMAIKLGDSMWGCSAGTDNWSTKTYDIYGGFSGVERGYSKTLSDSIFMSNDKTGYIQKLIQPFYVTPALWVASEDYEITSIYGFYRDFSIVLADWSGAQCSITIEGLT